MKKILIKFLKELVYFLSLIIPKNKKIIIFGSRDGLIFGDNSRYLFIYCNEKILSYKFIWLTKNPEVFSYLNQIGFKCYFSNSLSGIFYSLISNWHIFSYTENDISDCFDYNVNKINLWHGFGLKKFEENKIKKKITFFKRKFYCVYLNRLYSKNFLKYLSSDTSNLIVSNFPRNDILKSSDKSLLKKYRTSQENNFINKIRNNKYNIGYFPTYRKSGIDLIVKEDDKTFINIINENLIKNNSHVYFRSHIGLTLTKNSKYFNKELEKPKKYLLSQKRFSYLQNELDLTSILNEMDILISDYSGVIIDYLILNRPIILYILDIKIYEKNTGLIIDYKKIDFAYFAHSFYEISNLLNNYYKDPIKFSNFHATNRKKALDLFIENKECFKFIVDKFQKL